MAPNVHINNDNDRSQLKCDVREGFPFPSIVLQKLKTCEGAQNTRCNKTWLNITATLQVSYTSFTLLCLILSKKRLVTIYSLTTSLLKKTALYLLKWDGFKFL